MAWQRRDPATPLTVARRWAITSVRDELDYQALRIQQRTLEQRYHDHLDPLKGDDALYVLNEIDRLAARLGHRPEPWEVAYQARYPSSTLHRFFWPEALSTATDSASDEQPADETGAGSSRIAETIATEGEVWKSRLSEREIDVVQELVRGVKGDKGVAARLRIDHATVRTHRRRIAEKFGANDAKPESLLAALGLKKKPQ